MKIVSYNISNSKQWKIDKLLEMGADVLVVPEITCPEQTVLPEGYGIFWEGITWQYRGIDKWKGLGIIWKNNQGYVPDWYNPALSYGIPLVMGDVIILAFWPTKRKEKNDGKSYPQIAQEIIEEYLPHFKEKKVLIIGDFNCYVNQNDSSKEYGDILRINEILNQHGLFSAYHLQTGEAFGKESIPTYYHMYKENWPFFLDYTYTNMDINSFRLLTWEPKMSDHVGQEIILRL